MYIYIFLWFCVEHINEPLGGLETCSSTFGPGQDKEGNRGAQGLLPGICSVRLGHDGLNMSSFNADEMQAALDGEYWQYGYIYQPKLHRAGCTHYSKIKTANINQENPKLANQSQAVQCCTGACTDGLVMLPGSGLVMQDNPPSAGIAGSH